MPYTAIIFDLFGTLVPNFSRHASDQVHVQMARVFNVPYPEFWRVMGETINDRHLGGHNSDEDNLVEVCGRLNVKVGTKQIRQAVSLKYEFTRTSLVPGREVLKVLDQLKRRGWSLGLITNCSSAVPSLFPQSPLAQFIDIAVYSCVEGIKKPSLGIYQTACERLKVKPEECIYVGDGSSKELTGAAAAGMLPILKRADLTDVYDAHRPDVENWNGHVIDKFSELFETLSGLSIRGL